MIDEYWDIMDPYEWDDSIRMITQGLERIAKHRDVPGFESETEVIDSIVRNIRDTLWRAINHLEENYHHE